MNKNKLLVKQASILEKASEIVKSCDVTSAAALSVSIQELDTLYRKALNEIIEVVNKKHVGSLVRIFFINERGQNSAAVYYCKIDEVFYRLKYSEANTRLATLNALDKLQIPTYDVRGHNLEVLEYYGEISVL